MTSSSFTTRTPLIMPVVFCVFLGLFLAVSLGNTAEKQAFRNKFESGREYTLQTETDITLAAPNSPEQAAQKQKISQTVELKTSLDASTGNAVVSASFSSLKARIEIEGTAFDYDSENPASSPPFIQQMFGAFLQKSFTLVYDKNGAFVEFRDVVNLDPTPLGQGQSMTGKQLAETLRNTLEFGLPALPVAVGEKWLSTQQVEVPPLGALTMAGSATLDSISDNQGLLQAKISVHGEFKNPPPSAIQLVEVAPTSTYKGEVLFDVKKSLLTESLLTSSCQFKINGQDIQVIQMSKTALTVKKG